MKCKKKKKINTRRWWSVEVNFFTVLSIAGLVAASHSEHVHTVYLQPVNNSAGSPHFIQTQPRCRRIRGPDAAPHGCRSSCPSLVFNGEMPSWGRVLREAPAQKQLVVRECLLSVDDWSQRGCGERDGGSFNLPS